MKKIFFTICFVLSYLYVWSCTNFMAGKDATTDGSILVSYAADSYSLYGFLRYQSAADHAEGEMREIRDWDTGKPLGQIPQVAHTYSVVGNMNEHQLVIGETTYGGREELYGDSGIDYGSLIYIALERCRTAREAIQLIASLMQEYGYASEGESFTIADTQELWIMEVIGKGKEEKGAVWVARRIPDDCVSAHANQARITQIDFSDSNHENWYWAEDVVDFARQKGYFDGNNDVFSFSDTYNPLEISSLYICEARVWSFFRRVNSQMDKYLEYVLGRKSERMPLFIKPDMKVSAQDFKNYMRDQYEGTVLDITQGTDAGPWNTKLRYGGLGFKLDSVQYWYERPTATQQTGWSFVAQIRPYAPEQIGGIFWFGVDDAATNLYVPMYCTINRVPECMKQGNGDLYTYSPTSAFWAFNKVANWAYTKYSAMMPDIKSVQNKWEEYFNTLVPAIDQSAMEMSNSDARNYLTEFSCNQAEASTQAWNRLFEYLLVKYLDGQQRKEENGQFKRNEWGEPVSPIRPPFPEDYLRKIAPEIMHE
ncbi:MAG: C69 family dipeptidase [Paludibacteraceae bacterium]|nr:C69 family dipeptidase [Paludibacteraceae bacterium]